MNKIYSLVLILLIVILAISSYFFIKEIAENKKENELFEKRVRGFKNPAQECAEPGSVTVFYQRDSYESAGKQGTFFGKVPCT